MTSTNNNTTEDDDRRDPPPKVGGQPLLLDRASVAALRSDFLNVLLDPNSPFKKEEKGGCYTVDVNPECFSVFLHVAKFGYNCQQDDGGGMMIIPREKTNNQLEEQAKFWGIDNGGLYKEGIVASTTKYERKIVAKEAEERARLYNEYMKSSEHETGSEEKKCGGCNRKRKTRVCWKCDKCNDCILDGQDCPNDLPLEEGESREYTTEDLYCKLSSTDPCTISATT